MRAILRMMLGCLFAIQFNSYCLAQVGIITTYAGPLLVNGASATTQAIDYPIAVTPDGALCQNCIFSKATMNYSK
jgi:hypothetical protein